MTRGEEHIICPADGKVVVLKRLLMKSISKRSGFR
jgi:hypothetical protein